MIRRILAMGPVASQDVVVRQLRQRGERVTQATVSRDFRTLGVLKGPSGYTLAGGAEDRAASSGLEGEEVARAFREWVQSADAAGTLVVVRTGAGQAGPVALAIDRCGALEVAGTVAGDDTVFIAMRSAGEAKRAAKRLSSLARGESRSGGARHGRIA